MFLVYFRNKGIGFTVPVLLEGSVFGIEKLKTTKQLLVNAVLGPLASLIVSALWAVVLETCSSAIFCQETGYLR